jgi:hypothetical protein
MAPHELQFIISSAPSSNSSKGASLRTAARSHAARSAHARARRLRTIEYQAQKSRERNRPSNIADNAEPCDLPGCGPRDALSYHRRDPFMACAKQLKPFEQMLFDHCMFHCSSHFHGSGDNGFRCHCHNSPHALQFIRRALLPAHDGHLGSTCPFRSRSSGYPSPCSIAAFN